MWVVVGETQWGWWPEEPGVKVPDLRYAPMHRKPDYDSWVAYVDGWVLEVTGLEIAQAGSDISPRIKPLPRHRVGPEGTPHQPTPGGVGWEDFDWSI